MEEENKEAKDQPLAEVEPNDGDKEANNNKTSSGMDQNVAALLTYVLGFITGIIFMFLEKENRFVRFHALQSIITFGGLFILNFILTAIPIIGWLIGILLAPLSIIIWILLMVKAYQGKYFKLPIVGKLADEQLNKQS
ncbi:DUF4870 domain-containing protein [Virgibacillus sp. W0430]